MSEQPMNQEITSDDKLWAALSYLPFIWPIIAIIVLLMEDKKERPFIKYHAVQALTVGVAAFVLSFLCVGILIWIYAFYLAYQAYQGIYEEIPVITDFIKDQGWV